MIFIFIYYWNFNCILNNDDYLMNLYSYIRVMCRIQSKSIDL